MCRPRRPCGLLEDPEHEHAALGVVSVADDVVTVFSFGFVSTMSVHQ